MESDILSLSSVFMPNSHSEWSRVTSDFPISVPDDRVICVPIGVEPSRYLDDDSSAPPAHLERFRDCVLCVARIEGRKNQLALIEALQDTPFDLVLVGKETANQPAYVTKVRRAAQASSRVHILGPVTDEDKHWLYRLARVHALPSWMETAGISSLEAAMASCTLVVTRNGDTAEYFGDDAQYCDPADRTSIRDAVVRAAATPPSERLVDRLRSTYTWDLAAELTYRAYCVGLGLAASYG